MRYEIECDLSRDKLNTTKPFEKCVAIAENKDVDLNPKLMCWGW